MEYLADPTMGGLIRRAAELPELDRENLHAIACAFAARHAVKIATLETAQVMTVLEKTRAAQPVE